jgi:PAS domain S-box-containing protein
VDPAVAERALELAPSALALVGADGRLRWANAAYRRLFGLDPADLGRLEHAAADAREGRRRLRSLLATLIEDPTQGPVGDLDLVRGDGTPLTARLAATVVDDDESSSRHLLIAISDLTDERRRCHELERDRRRLTAMLTNISDTVTLIDAEAQVLDTTGRHTEILGYPPSFWNGRSLYDLTVAEDRESLVSAHREVLERPGTSVQRDIRVRHADGSLQELEVTAVNLLDDPEVGGIVVTSRNITERKQALAELAAARDEAVEQSRVRAEFVARVSHELRNQLHALRGLTELLATESVPRSVRDLAESAHRQARQFARLVDDLLDFSRMDSGRVAARPECTLVRQVVADAETLARQQAGRGVTVRSSTDEDVPDWVLLDGARVRQVIANLVSNAAKYTQTGEIRITLQLGELDGTPSLRFAVADTGRGIAPEDRERIFRPFDQGSRGDPSQGTGLGLSIADRIVSMLGGRIAVDSEPGKGSTFVVDLPFTRPCDDGTEEERVRPLERLVHVLVVEDDEVNQLLVSEQLRRLGAIATVVGTGAEALEVVASGRPIDCVLMDWQLPGMDGIETTRRLRADDRGRSLPVIGLTASTTPQNQHACTDAGMDEVLVKPVGLAELGSALRRWVPERVDADLDDADADVAALDRLVADLGATDPVRSIVRTYLRELDGRLEVLLAAVGHGDADTCRRVAHTLRSTSGTLGATGLQDACRDVECGAFPPSADLIAGLQRSAAATRQRLEDWLASRP